jgi:hypothetical protein
LEESGPGGGHPDDLREENVEAQSRDNDGGDATDGRTFGARLGVGVDWFNIGQWRNASSLDQRSSAISRRKYSENQ